MKLYEALDDQEDADVAQLEALHEKIDALQDRPGHWVAEDIAMAGAFVTIDNNGNLSIERGMVRPEDRPAAAGQGKGASGEQGAQVSRKLIPDSLTQRLTAHRTMALRATIQDRPDIALAAITHSLMAGTFYDFGKTSALELRVERGECSHADRSEGVERSPDQLAVAARLEQWKQRIPSTHAGAWGWIIKQSQETVLDLLAFCAAQTVNAVQHPHNTPDFDRLIGANQLAHTVGLNMADW